MFLLLQRDERMASEHIHSTTGLQPGAIAMPGFCRWNDGVKSMWPEPAASLFQPHTTGNRSSCL